MASSRPIYCSLTNDVLPRLFSANSQISLPGVALSPAALADPQRDALLGVLAADCSRAFDQETGVEAGHYAPTYDTRLYSGQGSQLMHVEHHAVIVKYEINLNPSSSAAPVWTDVTSEGPPLGYYSQLESRPIKFWPKRQIFRMNSWVTDPFEAGNVRLTGIFGNVQPDLGAGAPTTPWAPPSLPSATLDATHVTALQPTDGAGVPAGWWVTPEDVQGAVAEWIAYRYHKARAGYADQANSSTGPSVTFTGEIPLNVQRVINKYSREAEMQIACITGDGFDIELESRQGYALGQHDRPSRWGGWQTTGNN